MDEKYFTTPLRYQLKLGVKIPRYFRYEVITQIGITCKENILLYARLSLQVANCKKCQNIFKSYFLILLRVRNCRILIGLGK